MDSALLETIAVAGGLAGVQSRDDFGSTLERQWKRHERTGRPLSLLVVEIEYFRQYQDACDIVASDDCLDAIAAAILESIHQSAGYVFAWGPGQFAVLLAETGPLEAERVAREIRLQCEALMIPHPRSPVSRSVTVGLGLATARPSTGIAPISLSRDAEFALLNAQSRVGQPRPAMGRFTSAMA